MSGLLNSPTLLGLKIPAKKSPAYWQNRFTTWCKPPSDAEEDRISRTARMIQVSFVRGSQKLQEAKVFGKGSYKCNTNVRMNSDMDICIMSSQIVIHSDWNEYPTNEELDIVFSPGGKSNEEGYREFKGEIETSLRASFGAVGVARGSKAIAVHGSTTSRVDADVVPAYTLWNILPRSQWISPHDPRGHIGVAIFPDDGCPMIVNYPDQCYENGVIKNTATSRRYKKVVRILKRLNAELVGSSIFIAADTPPSFLIESLVWNVTNPIFLTSDDMYSIVVNVLSVIRDGTAEGANLSKILETNGIKPLFCDFGVYKQKWSRATAHSFAVNALNHLRS